MNASLQEHLAKEENFTKHSDEVLAQVNLQKEEEQVLYSKEMTAMQEHIDKQWQENVVVRRKPHSTFCDTKTRTTETRKDLLCPTRNQRANAKTKRTI